MRKVFLLLSMFLFLSITFLSAAQATTIYANLMAWETQVVSVDDVAFVANTDRNNLYNALGEADGNFFSIGLGKTAYFEFESLFDTQATIVEITWGTRSRHFETAEITVVNGDGVISSPAFSINNTLESTIIDLTGFASISPFVGLFIQDTSSGVSTDGWDIDSVGVSVAPVPEPATMMLFGIGLLGLAGISRRKK